MHPVLRDEHEVEAGYDHWQGVEHVDDREGSRFVLLARALGQPDIGHAILDLRKTAQSKHCEAHPIIGGRNHHCLADAGEEKTDHEGLLTSIFVWEREEKASASEANEISSDHHADRCRGHTDQVHFCEPVLHVVLVACIYLIVVVVDIIRLCHADVGHCAVLVQIVLIDAQILLLEDQVGERIVHVAAVVPRHTRHKSEEPLDTTILPNFLVRAI